MSVRPLGASVAPLVLNYDECSIQANIQHVETPRRGSYVLVTPGSGDAPGATCDASGQQEIHWSAEVASKREILSIATSSSRRTDSA